MFMVRSPYAVLTGTLAAISGAPRTLAHNATPPPSGAPPPLPASSGCPPTGSASAHHNAPRMFRVVMVWTEGSFLDVEGYVAGVRGNSVGVRVAPKYKL
eukprot:5147253-Pyramimonas_sp.AAC.2